MSVESPQFNQESLENKKPKEPWEMSYPEFLSEYEEIMRAVSEKEKKGKLDPESQPYEPLTEEEQKLLESDWKEFSRQRGFSEEDIEEYERWLMLSGQRENLEGAINDPWRRMRAGYDRQLYLKHIERALAEGKEIPPEILQEYSRLRESARPIKENIQEVPSPTLKLGDQENVW